MNTENTILRFGLFSALAFAFSAANRLEKAIRLILFLPLIVTVLSFMYFSLKFGIDRSYRFEVATLSINWLVSISVGILVAINARNSLKV